MKSLLIKDTTREERMQIVHQAIWGSCGVVTRPAWRYG